MKEVCTPL
jgi:uncharacterized protein (TIGR00730 family)